MAIITSLHLHCPGYPTFKYSGLVFLLLMEPTLPGSAGPSSAPATGNTVATQHGQLPKADRWTVRHCTGGTSPDQFALLTPCSEIYSCVPGNPFVFHLVMEQTQHHPSSCPASVETHRRSQDTQVKRPCIRGRGIDLSFLFSLIFEANNLSPLLCQSPWAVY